MTSEAAKKAWITRRKNQSFKPNIKAKKLTFKKIKEEDYTVLQVDTPVNIYIHKSMQKFYITPQKSKIK